MKVYLFCVSVLMILLACSKPEIDSKPYKVNQKDSTDIHYIDSL